MTKPDAERTEIDKADGHAPGELPVAPVATLPRRRRWYQFSLWTLFAITLLAAFALMGWRWTVAPYLAQADTMALVKRLGGSYQSQPAPKWMSRLAGQELGDATLVNLADCDEPDDYVAEVARLPRLEILVVGGQAFGDDEAAQLSGTTSLRWLILDSTSVSADALATVQDTNSDLQVYRSQRRTIAAIKAAGGALDFSKNDDYRDLHSLIGADFFDEPQQLDAGAANAMLVAQVTTLRHVSLYGAISNAALTEIARLPNLEQLALDQVADDGLRLLRSMNKLKHLSLVDCPITDAGLANLTEMKGLTGVSLGGTKITDAGLAHLENLTNLESLTGEGTLITDAAMSHLALLTRLKRLRLPRTKVGDTGLAHLAQHTAMEHLNLALTNVTDPGLAHLAAMSNLKELSVAGNNISDAAVEHLAKLTSLTQLGLQNTRITAAGAARLQKALPGCKVSWGVVTPPKPKA